MSRYVRITNAARVDVIGKVVGPMTGDSVLVEVPAWQADGYPLKWAASNRDTEPSTRAACLAAAKGRDRSFNPKNWGF
jgi:hypothetical protein